MLPGLMDPQSAPDAASESVPAPAAVVEAAARVMEAATQAVASQIQEVKASAPAAIAATPKSVAYLRITETADRSGYRVAGNFGEKALPESVLDMPTAAWADRSVSFEPEHLRKVMDGYSRRRSDIRKWIKDMRANAPEVRLVIVDLSTAAIPWELLRLVDDEYKYLGAEIPCSRWFPVTDPTGERLDLLGPQPFVEGYALCHVDAEEGSQVPDALGVLEAAAQSQCPQIHDLAQHLEQAEHPCALVYLYCHGHRGESPEESALGPAPPTGAKVSVSDLREQKLHLVQTSRPVVFLNACSSGQEVEDKTLLRDGISHGFTDIFLSKGAQGVIAARDILKPALAAEIGKSFLTQVSQPDAPAVAEILRRIRAEAVVAFQTNRDAARLWTVFQYVFYGSPDAQIRVKAPAPGRLP